jgi:diaminohydroxyphosphoribosylaminopyrimidine deaminase/5-amino-6-(5-phosphoribosylamino)uracil reductase
MHFTAFDERCMDRALTLAEASVGLASPNPQVGCVIVRGDAIIGEGAHLYDRFDHAEIVALKQAGDARGATAYVTLEPCSHHGRTGPCADALIAAGIARCVVATVDPNPLVSGQGIAKLRAAGIAAEIGLLEARARELNNSFALSITRQRPFVKLKAALSVDGMLAPPPSARVGVEPFWLTGAAAREEVQRLRHASDAILCGIGTVLADDPLLTDRTSLPRRRPLLRVAVDSHLRTPLSAKLVQTAEQDVWIFCGHDAPADRRSALEALGVRVTAVNTTNNGPVGLNPVEILAHLHSVKVLSVLLEAGSALNGAFLRHDLVDQAILFYAETELGPDALPFAEGTAGPFALEEKMLTVRKQSFGADVCVSGLLHDPWPDSSPLG